MEKETLISKDMPHLPKSYWLESVSIDSFPKLTGDIEAEVVVVGGGISGITSAYLLAKEGLNVVLLEAGYLFNGTTGHTTAKITAQHDLIYDELIQNFGKEKAQLYYKSNDEALQFIKQTIKQHDIQCNFIEKDAYIYTNSETIIKRLENEQNAYDKLEIHGNMVSQIDLPVPIKAAIVMQNQAQFHPLEYLKKLVQLFIQAGGHIYEHTTVETVEDDTQPVVVTSDGHKITCKHVVSCSHFPCMDGMGFYFARMHAERSYVIGVKSKSSDLNGMYLSADDPKRSVRTTTLSSGDNLILIGGESHKTGQGICTIKHYEALQAFAHTTFGIQEFPYRWSAQDLVTLDKIPYIGQISSVTPNVYVATGYRKWGMTTGTAAAILLRDLIIGKENAYQDLYTPSRFHAFPDVKTFIYQNVDVAKHLISGKLEIVHKLPKDLANDEGAVVSVNGKRAGAYRDEQGTLHVVDTTCTHMGCEVEWNVGDRSWDCPCHGSRFSIDGDVLEGPATKPLKQIIQ
ncbi:FAD-dependent oxidoreductase [Paenibacillus sp. UMB4589-SE434]|uniref:FAD-dependent oxidoreductase n=1 Tax=Paenibacillus sp. UMB4589-SE434 TaxID=3046314 RepID=UPI002549E58A|nr:FAD-dependent oxidoreductase [Paenibacillus sp. UMB4589-SE434]MDK8180294.1 FAD-dependent oxidoreductase [Paenibacillus sp. UMB4589-SE434]